MKLMIAITLVCAAVAQDAHPTLPTRWIAKTSEPGMGIGMESYLFNPKPRDGTPSALWSNYTDQGCNRLIYVASSGGSTANKRYLFGCDAVDCCYEQQSGNQVEFQIPNAKVFGKPAKVTHGVSDVTTKFETVSGADTYTWTTGISVFKQTFMAYTTNSGNDSTVDLHRWNIATPAAGNYSNVNVDFVNFTHVAESDQAAFDATFKAPSQQECRLSCAEALRNGQLKQATYDALLRRPTLLGTLAH